MIKVENIDVWGFKHAIRGMRNPMNSWDKSDSSFNFVTYIDSNKWYIDNDIGENDMSLMQRLCKAGPEHRKYFRYIFVSMDIIAPLYWWKEFDTYKFVVPDPAHMDSNSCSTMHKIAAKEFKLDDFSHEHLMDTGIWLLEITIDRLNKWRSVYVLGNQVYEPKNKDIWWQMIQLLPSSYNQRRTITMSYETVIAMIQQRNGHKLDEWNDFVKILKDLPYVEEIMRD